MTDNFAKDINVPHKEQIMIDGVDVSECDFSLDCIGIICQLKNGRTDKCHCSDYPNCYFKQHARKSQECEELKKELNGSEKWRVKAESLNEKLSIEKDRYRKALEEIKEVWAKDEDGDYDFVKWQILNIINKAKGEGNAT